MPSIRSVYARDLDLNLFRVLMAVADTGSVTAAAGQLYLTQPAISAALRRLSTAIGTPVVARRGRGVALTERGAWLVAEIRPHLLATIEAALAPPRFDARTSERTFRIGLSDATDEWLLPRLLRRLDRQAPAMRLVCVPTQFRTVGEAFDSRRIDLAITVADALPRSIARRPLFRGHFVCLYDPRFAALGARPSENTYFAHEHVIVSYNGDLRGVVEDLFGRERRVRCSVASFGALGAILDGGPLVATVAEFIAAQIVAQRPRLRLARFPLAHAGGGMDLLWPTALENDDACRFLRDAIVAVAAELARPKTVDQSKNGPRSRAGGSP